MTDAQDRKKEFVVWNATDLKKFPVKIEQMDRNTEMTSTCKDIKFANPDAAQFEPPAGFTNPTSAIQLLKWRFLGAFASQVVGDVAVGFQNTL
jgi:hypothetical protein